MKNQNSTFFAVLILTLTVFLFPSCVTDDDTTQVNQCDLNEELLFGHWWYRNNGLDSIQFTSDGFLYELSDTVTGTWSYIDNECKSINSDTYNSTFDAAWNILYLTNDSLLVDAIFLYGFSR